MVKSGCLRLKYPVPAHHFFDTDADTDADADLKSFSPMKNGKTPAGEFSCGLPPDV